RGARLGRRFHRLDGRYDGGHHHEGSPRAAEDPRVTCYMPQAFFTSTSSLFDSSGWMQSLASSSSSIDALRQCTDILSGVLSAIAILARVWVGRLRQCSR